MAWSTALGDADEFRKQVTSWFRGHSQASHELVPGAYRGKRDHESMFNRFVAAGAGVITPTPQTDWDWYFAAQHYELPTRLLDWSEDPFAALYFAVRGMRPDDADIQPVAGDPPVVWMMDPASLNFLAYGSYEIAVPSEGGGFTKYWRPGTALDPAEAFVFDNVAYSNKPAIAIWPTRTTPRIMAQNGCFTIHGSSKTPIESTFCTDANEHAHRLVQFRVSDPDRIDRELFDLGVTRLRLFPELHNVASLLRRQYPQE